MAQDEKILIHKQGSRRNILHFMHSTIRCIMHNRRGELGRFSCGDTVRKTVGREKLHA